MVKISIVIPVYNGEKYLEECIDSAFNQTYRDIEIIIVNDGSTDNTRKIMDYYDGAIITKLDKENGGPASALNMGIRASGGDFIKWLSADDVLNEYAVETMVKYALQREYENTIFYTNYHVIDGSSNIISEFREPNRNELTPYEKNRELLRYYYGNGSSSLIHKSIFKRCGLFDESLKHSEDYEYWLRCALIYGVGLELIPQFTLKYRTHADQLTKKVGGSLNDVIRAKILNTLPCEERRQYE